MDQLSRSVVSGPLLVRWGGHEPMGILRRYAPQGDAPFVRAMVGLEVLAEFAKRRSSTVEQVTQRVRDAVEKAQNVMFRNSFCAGRWKLKKPR